MAPHLLQGLILRALELGTKYDGFVRALMHCQIMKQKTQAKNIEVLSIQHGNIQNHLDQNVPEDIAFCD